MPARLVAALAVSLICTSAQADPVRIDTDGSAQPMIRIFHAGLTHPLKVCVRGCSTDLPEGRYRIEVSATPGTYAYDDEVTVRGPTHVMVDPGDKTSRRTLIVIGWTLFGASLPVFMWAAFDEWQNNPETGEKGHFGGISVVGSVLAGTGIAALIGAASMKPSIEARRATFGLAPTANGVAMAGSWMF
jgi:hypothetical protein